MLFALPFIFLLAVAHQVHSLSFNFPVAGWPGPAWWPTPYWHWTARPPFVAASPHKAASLALLTHRLDPLPRTNFALSASVYLPNSKLPKPFHIGFRLGRRAPSDNYIARAVDARVFVELALHNNGRLRIGDALSPRKLFILPASPVRITAHALITGKNARITFSARQKRRSLSFAVTLPAGKLRGGLSLLTSSNQMQGGGVPRKGPYDKTPIMQMLRFTAVQLSGSMVSSNPRIAYGPIAFATYAVSGGTLRLRAQLAPIGRAFVSMHAMPQPTAGSRWRRVASAWSGRDTHAAVLSVPKWDASRKNKFSLRVKWNGKTHTFTGEVQKAPQGKFRLAAMSCDKGYVYPQHGVALQVQKARPHIVAFLGDQFYSGVKMSKRSTDVLETFQATWLRFGLAWRHVLRNHASVLLPDDHDVGQGNLWGSGGRRLRDRPSTMSMDDWFMQGGYALPPRLLRYVEDVHTGHLPPPAWKKRLEAGMTPFFTSINWGSVSLAILEDRKFKSGPLSLSKKHRFYGTGGDLLGAKQEAFLQRWTKRKMPGIRVKLALSGTPFGNLATHQYFPMYTNRYNYDSGGWPVAARHRVVRTLGNAGVLSIHGDQHFAMVCKLGVKKYGDGGHAVMVPGIANGFPRTWWPGVKPRSAPKKGAKFTGRFLDGWDNPTEVLAVANPEVGSWNLDTDKNPLKVAYRRASGWGLIDVDVSKLEAKVSMYRTGGKQGEQFDGFPVILPLGRPASVQNTK